MMCDLKNILAKQVNIAVMYLKKEMLQNLNTKVTYVFPQYPLLCFPMYLLFIHIFIASDF